MCWLDGLAGSAGWVRCCVIDRVMAIKSHAAF